MDNIKNDEYYISRIFSDLAFVIQHMRDSYSSFSFFLFLPELFCPRHLYICSIGFSWQ